MFDEVAARHPEAAAVPVTSVVPGAGIGPRLQQRSGHDLVAGTGIGLHLDPHRPIGSRPRHELRCHIGDHDSRVPAVDADDLAVEVGHRAALVLSSGHTDTEVGGRRVQHRVHHRRRATGRRIGHRTVDTADPRTHAPRMIAHRPPVVDADAGTVDRQPSVPAADLVVAGDLLGDPTGTRVEVMLFGVRVESGGEHQVGGQWGAVTGPRDPHRAIRLEDLHREVTDGGLRGRGGQRPRPSRVELTTAALDRSVPVADPDVLVQGHAGDEPGVPGGIDAGKPVPVVEPRVGGAGEPERPRHLMHQGLVERVQGARVHRSTSNALSSAPSR